MRFALRLAGGFLLAFVLVAASAWVPHVWRGQAVYNHECRTPGGGVCVEPQETAGWPLPFLYDSPHTSVVHQVSPGEDAFRAGPFWVNVALVGALAGAALTPASPAARRARRDRT